MTTLCDTECPSVCVCVDVFICTMRSHNWCDYSYTYIIYDCEYWLLLQWI